MFVSDASFIELMCKGVDFGHVKPCLLHEFFHIQGRLANKRVQEMWKQVEEDLAFRHIEGLFKLYVQGIFCLFFTYFHFGHIIFPPMFLLTSLEFCGAFRGSLHLRQIWPWNFIMKRSPRKVIDLLQSYKNWWKRQWSRWGRTIIQLATNTFLFVITFLGSNFCRKFRPIMTTTWSLKCSLKYSNVRVLFCQQRA
jgi:hypothetical protein